MLNFLLSMMHEQCFVVPRIASYCLQHVLFWFFIIYSGHLYGRPFWRPAIFFFFSMN